MLKIVFPLLMVVGATGSLIVNVVTHGFYHVNVREGKGWAEFHTFRTIKAAAKFIETALPAR